MPNQRAKHRSINKNYCNWWSAWLPQWVAWYFIFFQCDRELRFLQILEIWGWKYNSCTSWRHCRSWARGIWSMAMSWRFTAQCADWFKSNSIARQSRYMVAGRAFSSSKQNRRVCLFQSSKHTSVESIMLYHHSTQEKVQAVVDGMRASVLDGRVLGSFVHRLHGHPIVFVHAGRITYSRK